MVTMNKKPVLVCLFLFIFAVSSYGNTDLSVEQSSRAEKVKKLLGDADTHTLSIILGEIKKSSYPEGELQIHEAVAQTFRDMVQKYQPADKEARIRLLDKVRMNMAYFQLGGPDAESPRE